jgi:hypothetical protein
MVNIIATVRFVHHKLEAISPFPQSFDWQQPLPSLAAASSLRTEKVIQADTATIKAIKKFILF